jgi:hypothetical protein
MERYICTKEHPWKKEYGNFAQHPDAIYVKDKDYGDGDYVACYKCPNCGLSFDETLSQ